MATLYAVLCSIQTAISSVTTGLISNSPDTLGKPLTVEVGLYWPSAKALQNNVRPANGPGGLGPSSLVTIYDRGLAADSTRWAPQVVSTTLIEPTLTAVLAASGIGGATGSVSIGNGPGGDAFTGSLIIPPLGFVTVTFAGPVSVGDAVGVIVTPSLFNSEGVVPIAIAGDTPSTFATKLVTLIAADPVLDAMVAAFATGPVVTISSSLPTAALGIQVNLGNGGTRVREVGRRKRHFQIVVWTRTPDDRITVGDPIEALIAGLEADFGLTFADGSLGRLTFSGDTQHDEATLSDTLRRDFMVCIDYGITVTDMTYSVLAPIVRNTIF